MPAPAFYFPARYATAPKPREVSITYSRAPDGDFVATLSEADLDYLIAREFQRQRELLEAARRKQADATASAKPFRKGKSNRKPKPTTTR